jgi:hypothetical protein
MEFANQYLELVKEIILLDGSWKKRDKKVHLINEQIK